ncbi:sugar ABC transporter permease [Mycoplasmatota bacterium]|nr:sugar ABC transporter permease [Mycoplasmatota bacterium]
MEERKKDCIMKKNKNFIGKKAARFKKKIKSVGKEIYVKRELYYLMAPYLVLFAVFTILPVIMSIVLSFTNFNMLELPDFVGWSNYKRLFIADREFIIAIKNTLILALVTGPVSYILAFVIAWLINELPKKMRSIMTLVFYAPSISGNAFLIWTIIFSGDVYGYANAYLMEFGITSEAIQWLKDPQYILLIVIIVQLWMSLGVSFLAFIAGLQGVDKSLYEAGAIDGIKNRWQELWYITLPSMKPLLLFGAVMQITSSFATCAVSIQLVGFPSVQYAGHTIVIHLMDYSGFRYEMGYASAIATVLFLTTLGANLIIQKLLRRVGS